jgi:hypothetical protein
MRTFLLILLVVAIILASMGYHVTNGAGSADERVGGSYFWLASAIAFALAVCVAFGLLIFGGH